MNTNELISRLRYLDELLEAIQQNDTSEIKGYLRIANSKKSPQYYHVTDSEHPCGTYLRKSERAIAEALAMQDYLEKLRKTVLREKLAIEDYLRRMQGTRPEDVHGSLNAARQQIVRPLAISDEEYAKRWLATPYIPKGFRDSDPEYYSSDGLRVRSKSEAIIADMLQKNNIPFKYEAPLILNGYGEVNPDFSLLNIRLRSVIYLEHFGMMDNEAYQNDFFWKMHYYSANNIILGKNLLVSFESSNNPMNIRDLKAIILKHLK